MLRCGTVVGWSLTGKAQQRLHDQLNVLCPSLSAPAGHGRSLPIETPTGQAVLACAVAFADRAPSARSLIGRSPGKLTKATAEYWAGRWRDCLPPPPDAAARAERLDRDLNRYRSLLIDVAAVEDEIEVLLAGTDGQVLTSLPGGATSRAAAFAAHSLPIRSFPDAEHLYSATGLAPAMYESATIRRRGRISRQGLAEHRDALMGLAWGLSLYSPTFAERDAELRARGMAPIQARGRARPQRLPPGLPHARDPTTLRRRSVSSRKAQPRTVTATLAMPLDGAI